MSRKNKAPKAPKAPKPEVPVTPFNKELKTGICIALALILIFASGNFIGSLTAINSGSSQVEVNPTEETSGNIAPTVVPTTIAPATTIAPDTTAPAADTTAPAADTTAPAADTTAPAADTTAPASTGAPQSKAEIVAYFNEAANKIKTDASSVVRNYEDLQHNEEKLEVPSALKTIGSSLISTFLKKDETPVTYQGQEIIDNIPIKGQNVVSTAKESDITEATCTDEGANYKIKLKFITATDPVDSGAATAFNIMNAEEIYSAASMVKSFSAEYYDAEIECTVDKASGHITWINYKLPIVLSVTAQVVVTLDAKVGMTFIDDYTVNY